MRESAFAITDQTGGFIPIRLQLPEGRQKTGVTPPTAPWGRS